jgi:hypothetical protein
VKILTQTLTRNRRPHWYKKGTRVHVVTTEANIDMLDRQSTAMMDTFRPATSYGMQVGNAVAAAINSWMGEFGPKPPAEELCLFISFTTFEIVVEVSDANRHEFDERDARGVTDL